jgi:hypothetical protein
MVASYGSSSGICGAVYAPGYGMGGGLAGTMSCWATGGGGKATGGWAGLAYGDGGCGADWNDAGLCGGSPYGACWAVGKAAGGWAGEVYGAGGALGYDAGGVGDPAANGNGAGAGGWCSIGGGGPHPGNELGNPCGGTWVGEESCDGYPGRDDSGRTNRSSTSSVSAVPEPSTNPLGT